MPHCPGTLARSRRAVLALELVSELQQRFVEGLSALAERRHTPQTFTPHQWLRDGGRHGGGLRHATADGPVYARGSVNVSQVHYDDEPERRLGSATALSTIIHPVHPMAPSVHIHISWTETKSGRGYWRMMADLNPATPVEEDRATFLGALEEAAPLVFHEAREQGDRYFYIPALGRTRGVAHFYLEQYATDDEEADRKLARRVGMTGIDTYLTILGRRLANAGLITDDARGRQLEYHTLYFFQVLTLDRGTTTGLLVHDQNDLGIMGSLPPRVDRRLLRAWKRRVPHPQDALVQSLLDALPQGDVAGISDEVKLALAKAVRAHYRAHPEAIEMQASGGIIPPTLANHLGDDTPPPGA